MKILVLFLLVVNAYVFSDQTMVVRKEINYLDNIEFHGSGTIYLTQGDKNELVMEAPYEVLQEVKLDADIGHLAITRKSRVFKTPSANLVCRMTVKGLYKIVLSGGCVLEGEMPNIQILRLCVDKNSSAILKIQGKRLISEMAGNAKIEVSGSVDDEDLIINGPGIYQGADLNSRICHVRVKGPGQASVRADEELVVSIAGSGKVLYFGEPKKITQNIWGSGQLLNRQ
jgi:hypothetical protein